MRGLQFRWLVVALVSVLAANLQAQDARPVVVVEWAPDATEALQDALDFGGKIVIVPCVGRDWVVSAPLRVYSDTTLILLPGVVMVAKEGAFAGCTDCMLWAQDDDDDPDANNIDIRGYGAVICMRKQFYLTCESGDPDGCPGSQHRHCIRLRGVRDVNVLGLTLESSGGDGVYIGGGGAKYRACQKVTLQDLVCRDNARQGISVTSVVTLDIVNCLLEGSSGHAPRAGIILEPNFPSDEMRGITISNCVSRNNAGCGYGVALQALNINSAPVDITFTDCLAIDNGSAGVAPVWIATTTEDNPKKVPSGTVIFKRCTFSGPNSYGAFVRLARSDRDLKFLFDGCTWCNVAGIRDHVLHLEMRKAEDPDPSGGIHFVDCVVDDTGRDQRKVYRIRNLDPSGHGKFNFGCSIKYRYTYSEPREEDIDVKPPAPRRR